MKQKRNNISILFSLLPTLVITGCIEPFEVTFEDFESAIVVEATITNEIRQQRVFLTRTFKFEEDGPSPEVNASIRIVGGGVTYGFQEDSPGNYVSEQAFAAQKNTPYQLFIETQDGRSYSSTTMELTQSTQIDDVKAERFTNDDGKEGVGIFADSFDSSGKSVNYRYEYEETYKIKAPFWTPEDLEGVPLTETTDPCEVREIPDEKSKETCFATDFSNAIIQTSTSDLGEDRVDDFMVRFISKDNYIISHRYSILVRQFVQSNEAFTFYQTLNEFAGNESFFSETQPGFLEGNITSNTNENEKVLGYFDVASVAEQRLFFNYSDLFPGEDLPPYIDPCITNAPLISSPGMPPRCVLRTQIEMGLVSYVGENDSPESTEGPFVIVPKVCGDCTEIGKAEPPEFWIE